MEDYVKLTDRTSYASVWQCNWVAAHMLAAVRLLVQTIGYSDDSDSASIGAFQLQGKMPEHICIGEHP
jgi:hypothetical protein